jgi:putative transcriptional regulator
MRKLLLSVVLAASLLGPAPAPAMQSVEKRVQADAPRSGLWGKVLIASPYMNDPTFRGTVVLLLAHDDAGAVGVILNRPGDVAVKDLAVQNGGPVGRGLLFALHSDQLRTDHARVVAPGVALSNDPQLISRWLDGQRPEEHLLAIGYAGWAPGQLERELRMGAWTTAPADADLVFAREKNALWAKARARAESTAR